MRAGPLSLFVAGLLVTSTGWSALARVVDGRDEATLLPPPGAVVLDYENHGYSLRRNGDGTVSVRVDLAPLASRAPFASRGADVSDPVGRLAAALTAGAGEQYDAVSRVLAWVSDNIEYDLDREVDQSAESVLERRSAYCTGIARLTVALLASVGIEAREVPGYVVVGTRWGPPPGFHRWVEVRYPDRGWVFSDPVATHHFVPATYLRLADDRLEGAPGTGSLVDRDDRGREIDLWTWNGTGREGLRVRANDAGRRAAALVVRLRPEVDATAILEGEGSRRVLDVAGGSATFLGLEPGRYELRVEHAGRRAAWKRLTFRDRILAEIEVPVGTVPPEESESR